MKEQVKWLFSEWDSNDDGVVSKGEFKDCLASLCDQMSAQDVDAVVQLVAARPPAVTNGFHLLK